MPDDWSAPVNGQRGPSPVDRGRSDGITGNGIPNQDAFEHMKSTSPAQNRNTSFPSSTWTTVMGPSGSGKSTLLHSAGGLEKVADGDGFVEGHNITAASTAARKMQGNQLRGNLHYRCVLKRDYPGADHPKSLSVREEHLLPIVDNWLSELFAPANIEGTCMTLAKSQRAPQTTVDELEARRTIKECDDELANYRAALKSAPSETVALWIAETEDRRKAAELRLRSMTTARAAVDYLRP